MPEQEPLFEQRLTQAVTEQGLSQARHENPNLSRRIVIATALVGALALSVTGREAQASPISTHLEAKTAQSDVYDPPVNTNDPTYQPALNKYTSDLNKVNAKPFAGDKIIRAPLFNYCPMSVDYSPDAKLVRSKDGKLSTRLSLRGYKWCDLVGDATATIRAEYKRPNSKKYIQTGDPTKVAIDGQRKQLVFWGYNTKNVIANVPMDTVDTNKVCTGNNSKDTVMRLRILQKFTPDRNQTIQHNYGQSSKGFNKGYGKSNNMESNSARFVTLPKKVCT